MTETAIPHSPSHGFPRTRWPSRRQLLIGGAGLVLAFAIVLGARWWAVGRFMVGTDNAYVRADIVIVAPHVAGYLAEVNVRDNQIIRVGDVIARIEDRDYQAKVQQAEAALASSKAMVSAEQAAIANLEAQSSQQQSNIAQTAASLQARQAESHLADLELQRQTSLSRQQVSSTQVLETAEANARKASAGFTEARAALAASRRKLPMLKTEKDGAVAELQKAMASVSAAQAALNIAKLDLARTVIRAPSSGIVGQRVLRVGQYVEPGAPLLAIVPSNNYVVANFKETQTNHVHPGQPVEIEVDALGGMVLKGRVESFAPASGAEFALLPPDNATGNFTKIIQRMPVRVSVNPGQSRMNELRPGISVEATVDTRDARQ